MSSNLTKNKFSLEYIRRALWTFKQPLADRPRDIGSPVSDLFVWRKSKDWKTFFELNDIASYFEERTDSQAHAHIYFFDSDGGFITKELFHLYADKRNTIEISAIEKLLKRTR